MRFKHFLLGFAILIILIIVALQFTWVSHTAVAGCGASSSGQVLVADPAFQDSIIQARELVLDIQQKGNIPGIAVCVSVDGQLVWAEGFGCADVKNEIPATVHSRFRVGSIGKSMTGLAVGNLIEEDRLDLDASVWQYVPYFPKKEYDVTVRQLAGHQGGIRHYRGLEMFSRKHYDSVEGSMEKFQKSPLKFKPGTDFQYTTYGYVLLSAVIEEASGLDYLDYMAQEVFTPLGMSNTIPDDNTQEIEGRVSMYSTKKNKVRPVLKVDLSNKWGGGGFLSTPYDLIKMVNNIPEMLDSATWELLSTPQTFADGTSTGKGYGIGWRVSTVQSNQKKLIHHGGVSVGGRAFLLNVPDDNIVVAICSNSWAVFGENAFGLQEAYDIAKKFMEVGN